MKRSNAVATITVDYIGVIARLVAGAQKFVIISLSVLFLTIRSIEEFCSEIDTPSDTNLLDFSLINLKKLVLGPAKGLFIQMDLICRNIFLGSSDIEISL